MTKLDHLGVQVADRNTARDWYVETLGLEVEFELPDAGVTALRDEADFTIFLSESPNVVPECTLYFRVDDVDRLQHSLADRGVAFVYAPQQNPWGYGAELLDPDGHTVRLWDEVSMKRHAESQSPP
jgi:catechol 2,3-dioxygenase-like lactoylglutathione lyase family enzyme